MARSSLVVLAVALLGLAHHVAAQAAAAAAGTAAVADPCASSLTFFPANYEDSNQPAGWTQSVQSQAGNTRNDQMIKIALAGYPIPTLQVMPESVFTTVGGQVPGSCLGAGAGAAAILAAPAAFTVQWALAGQTGTLGPFLKGDKTDPPANVTLSFVPNLPDGNYCVDIALQIAAGTGVAVVGTQQVKVPAATQRVVRQVCFLKLSERPTANVTFHSCNDSFAVDLASIQPPPIFARYPDIQMFSTVFHVWGKLNKTFTADPPADGALDYFDQYVRWSDPTQPPLLQVFLDTPNLINGYYTVNIEGSLSTAYPQLVDLFGADTFDDGSAKFMGVVLRNASNKPVPIQTVKSKILNLAGPDGVTPAGGQATFTWDTQGYGEQFCYIDGQKISNTADQVHCESPLTLAINDNKNHTLEVVLSDVCGDMVANGLFFSSQGWTLDAKYQPPAPPPVAELPLGPLPPPISLNRAPMILANNVTSAALGARPSAYLSTLGALLAGIVGLAALMA